MTKTAKDIVHLDWLVHMFHADREPLGEFEPQDVAAVPEVYRRLLAHDQHMTVTVEQHYGCQVDVDILQRRIDEPFYSREILLRCQGERKVVQYGIVRLFLPVLEPAVREEILAGQIPLGRIMIAHDVLRQVKLGEVWRVRCGPRLSEVFDVPAGSTTYGRTALIYFDSQPALELLEIVAPQGEAE